MCPGIFRLLTLAGDVQEMDGGCLASQSLQASLLSWQFRNGKKIKKKGTNSILVRTKHYLHPAVVPVL